MPGQLFHHLDGSNHIPFDEKEKFYERRRFEKQYFRGFAKLIVNSFDQSTMFFAFTGNELLTLYFIGHNCIIRQNCALDQYAALIMVFACSNIMINKVILAFTASLQTLMKEALRHHHYHKIHIYLKKTTIVLYIWTMLSLVILNLFGASLRWLKFSEDFSQTAQAYFALLCPYYFFHIFFSLMKSLYLSHGNMATPAFLNMAKLILNIVFNTFFFAKFGPNLIWSGIIKIFTEVVVTAFFYMYAHENRFFINAFTQNWTPQIFRNLGRFLQVLSVKGSFIYLDRVTYDVLTLITAFQHQPLNLIVQGSLAAYASCLLSIPFGVISTTSQHLKSAIHEGSESKARNALLRGCILCFIIGIFYTILSLPISTYLPKLLWSHVEFEMALNHFIQCYPIILWGEIGFNLLNIIFRNLGQKKIIWKCLIASSFLIGIPTSIVIGFKPPYTLQGIWGGRMISLFCTYIILIKKLMTLDWWTSIRRVYFSRHHEEILIEI